MLTIREYKQAATLEEAWQLNQKRPNRVLGGMLWMRLSKGNVQTAIDLSALGLDTIEETETEFRIGAMVSLRRLELHVGFTAYSEGANTGKTLALRRKKIVGVQFRNLATVGGSVFGRFGFSDVLTLLLVMDSYVELYKGGIVPLADFVNMPYDRDILVRVIVKKTAAHYSYKSVRISKTDFPVLTCAAALTQESVQVAVGRTPGEGALVKDAEQLATLPMTAEKAVQYRQALLNQNGGLQTYCQKKKQPAWRNSVVGAAYRTHLIKVLTARCLIFFSLSRKIGEVHKRA